MAGDDSVEVRRVARAAAGDQEAFGALIRTHQDMIYGTALRILGSEADARDAAQEAVIAAWQRLGTYRGDAPVGAWLRRIAANAALDLHRARRRRAVPFDPQDAPAARMTAAAGDPHDERVRAQAVRAAIDALDEPFRAALLLADVAGLPYEDIAAELGVAVGTVKSRVARGRMSLATMLEPERPTVRPPHSP
jgi:RNA polymerase sigma-70 factor (ECF subfamily)